MIIIISGGSCQAKANLGFVFSFNLFLIDFMDFRILIESFRIDFSTRFLLLQIAI
jgi:hypothetical protein